MLAFDLQSYIHPYSKFIFSIKLFSSSRLKMCDPKLPLRNLFHYATFQGGSLETTANKRELVGSFIYFLSRLRFAFSLAFFKRPLENVQFAAPASQISKILQSHLISTANQHTPLHSNTNNLQDSIQIQL